MTFNQDPRIRVFLFSIALIIIAISYLTKILTDNFLYKYLDSFKSKLVSNVLIGLHWTISIVSALMLPEYSMKYDFFKEIFKNSQVWVYLSTLCVFFISLILIGGILNLIFYRRINKVNRNIQIKNNNH